jgi:hypothetical protein
MDCSQIRDAFMTGAREPAAQLEEHLTGCPQCRELFAQNAALGRHLATQAGNPVRASDDLFGQIEGELAREKGPRAWLRSRPTPVRFTLVLLPLLLVLIAGGLLRQRADLEHYPMLRVALLLCVYFLAITLALGKKLSESPRRDALGDYVGLLTFAVAVPALAAFAPATAVAGQAAPDGALGCFGYGALLTLPIALLIWALDRNDRPSLRTVCLSAAALGLSANLLLELHCANNNPEHLLLGHASLGVAWLAAWLIPWCLGRAARPNGAHLRK